jgi:AraC-like DNA-binding protein
MRAWHLTAPWGLEFAKAGPGFIIVREGTCQLQHAGMAGVVPLRQRDFVLFTRPAALAIRDQSGSRVLAGDHLVEAAGTAPRDAFQLGGGGAATCAVWGNLVLGDDYTRQAFALLPPLVMAHGDGPDGAGLAALIGILLDAFENRRPGGEILADRALQALFVYALRSHPLTLPPMNDLVPALNVPGMGLALAAIHTHPEQQWSVRDLANRAGLSRSKFALRFVEVFGCPPFDYLRDVRMRLACRLLCESDHGIKEISARAGYATEASFSRAFSQWCGCAPGAYRRQKRTLPAEG